MSQLQVSEVAQHTIQQVTATSLSQQQQQRPPQLQVNIQQLGINGQPSQLSVPDVTNTRLNAPGSTAAATLQHREGVYQSTTVGGGSGGGNIRFQVCMKCVHVKVIVSWV